MFIRLANSERIHCPEFDHIELLKNHDEYFPGEELVITDPRITSDGVYSCFVHSPDVKLVDTIWAAEYLGVQWFVLEKTIFPKLLQLNILCKQYSQFHAEILKFFKRPQQKVEKRRGKKVFFYHPLDFLPPSVILQLDHMTRQHLLSQLKTDLHEMQWGWRDPAYQEGVGFVALQYVGLERFKPETLRRYQNGIMNFLSLPAVDLEGRLQYRPYYAMLKCGCPTVKHFPDGICDLYGWKLDEDGSFYHSNAEPLKDRRSDITKAAYQMQSIWFKTHEHDAIQKTTDATEHEVVRRTASR